MAKIRTTPAGPTGFITCLLLAPAFVFPAPACAAPDWSDPFGTASLPAASAYGSIRSNAAGLACAQPAAQTPLGLAEVVDLVLCRNPKSGEAWASARFQAAQVGVARAPYLPGVSVNGDAARNWSDGAGQDDAFNSVAATASLSYLLYDFGGRDAALENARQLFAAASASQDNVVQGLFFAAIQGYHQVHAAEAALASAQEAERSAQASLDAATARYKAGVGTPADRLQAQTAHSQAVLDRIRVEGDLKNARGALANLMGMDADQPYTLQAPAEAPSYEQFQANVGDLIADARRRRPDLAAAEAEVLAARANVDAAVAAGKPSVSVTTEFGYRDQQFADATRSGALGLNVTIPLFTGFASTYRIRSAAELVEAKRAARDQVNLQVALDVWRAYQNLQTETQSVRTSRDLVASATQNADVALGRYKVGVGNIIEVLTAQSALASARAQRIQAMLNWDVARVSLAFAMGQLDDVASVAPGTAITSESTQ